MSIKSLLLGSAAALVAVSGAQAADAVVIAEPEPVEYVRVCDVYGTGYFYIPGTETCLRIGGYVRYQASGGDLWERSAVDHEDGSINETWNKYARLSLQTWTGTETELGTLKTYTETRFQWGNGSPSGPVIFDTDGDGFADSAGGTNGYDGTSVTLNFAWIELGGFRVGKDESAYTVFLDYAGGVIADDLVPYGPFDTNLISYTFSTGNGFSAIVSLETGADDSYGHDYSIDSYVPHVVAGAKFTQGWGGIGIVGGYDSIHENWAVKARLDIKATEALSFFLMGGWGDDDADEVVGVDPDTGLLIIGETGANFYKPWGGEWAIWGGMTAQVSEKAVMNLQLGYDDSEQFGASLNVQYELVPGFRITPEIDYYDNGDDDAFGGIIRFQRSF
ncbi:porin [Arvimicrobium flavum]|uniref:porin n=1 Tax=Arvimicrobium flavum TaxID=3393320 RepID=UPI00237B2D85|nr:porin [Mesorhizobium shangrilense]